MNHSGLQMSQLDEITLWFVKAPHVGDGGPTFCDALASFLRSMGMPLWRISYTLTV
ncbi:MAG: hypothetical protein H7249_20125 [Chitinophagaceae bacterium]|nr:hypothetical protein [Oligoflexus sp.]